MPWRSCFAEALGTGLLVFFGVGVATLSFGFRAAGTSVSAGVVATALTFGLVLLVLVYAIGPISGCHINPAVTIGFLVARRIDLTTAVSYWASQIIGGIVGAGLLRAVFSLVPGYSTSRQGLGTDGYGKASLIDVHALGAFIAEVVLTFLFVFVILCVTKDNSYSLVAGVAIGLALALCHLIGIPIDGTSVNPARALAPALFVGGTALNQVWLFIVAPLVGGSLSAAAFFGLYGNVGAAGSKDGEEDDDVVETIESVETNGPVAGPDPAV